MAVSGDLRDMPLTTLISINCNEYNQSRLRLQHKGQEAVIFFDEGQLVHMTLEDRQGEEVIYELLTWEEGSFELEMNVPPPARTVNTHGSNLVLDGMRIIDEGAAGWEVDLDGWEEPTPEESEQVETKPQEPKPKEVTTMVARKRSDVLDGALSDLLAASTDIEGALVVSADGLVMVANLPKGMEEARVGASAAALLGLSRRSTPALGRGNFTQSLIQGEDGNIVLVSAGERAIFVGLTSKDANLGMVFLEARDAAATIAETM